MSRPLLFACLLLFVVSGAPAQEDPRLANGFQPPTQEELEAVEGPARLALYMDPVSRSVSAHAEVGESLPVSLVAVGAETGINAWEVRLVVDPRLAVSEVDLKGGLDLGQGEGVFRVGLGKECRIGQEVVLATFRVTPTEEASDMVLGLAPVEGGSFDPPAPGYLGCLSLDDLFPFAASDTLAVVNPEAVRPATQKEEPFRMERAGGEGR